jgi:hypothetical protein
VSVRRRAAIPLLLAVLLLLAAVLVYVRLPVWSAAVVARDLSTFFHRPVTTGAVRYRLFPPQAEIDDLRVAGATPGAEPFLEARRITAVASLRPLWRRRLVLSSLRLQGLKIRIHAFEPEGDDIPRMGGGEGGGGAEVRIDRLVVQGGEFEVNHERVPLELDLPGFRGQLQGGSSRVLSGSLSFGPGTLRFGENPLLGVATRLQATIDGPRIAVSSGRIESEHIDLDYRGQLDLGERPRGVFQVGGKVDLAVLDRHVMRTGFGIRGAGRYQGAVSIEGSRFRLRGRLEGADGVFDEVPVPRYAGEVDWDDRGVHLRHFDVTTLGGAATLDVDVPPGPSVARLRGTLRGVDAERTLMAVFDIGEAGLGASATGDLDLRWPRGHVAQLSGTMAYDLAERPDGRTPVAGRFEWRAERGVQFIERAELRTPATRVHLAGRIETDDHAELAVEAASGDLGASDELGRRVRRALGVRDAELLGFTGAGVFRGHWRGTLHEPVFEGRFEGEQMGYLGVDWGRADWTGAASADQVRSDPLVLRKGAGELVLRGSNQTGFYGERDALDLRVRLREWPARELAQALDWQLQLEGPLSGEVTLRGRRSAPESAGAVSSERGTYYRVPYTAMSARFEVHGPVTVVSAGEAAIGGGRIRFRGTADEEGSYDGRADLEAVEAAEVVPALAAQASLAGRLSGSVLFQGTLERPRLEAHLAAPRVTLAEEPLTGVEATVLGRGDGRLRVEARSQSADAALELTGEVEVGAPHRADLRLAAQRAPLDAFLRPLLPSLPAGSVTASGEVEMHGPLAEPKAMVASAGIGELVLTLPEYALRNRGPIRLEAAEGRLRVSELRLAGEGTDLTVQGEAGLAEDVPLALSLRGSADLRALTVVSPRLKGRGGARLVMTVSGNRHEPRLEGTLTLEGAGFRVRDFPHGLEDVRGTVRFTERVAELKDLTGTLGGGAVDIRGQVAYAQKTATFDVRAEGRGIALRYPEGLKSVLDADLRLLGDTNRPWVTGSVDVKQAVWTRRYDLASELLSARREGEATALLQQGVRLDVKVHAPVFRLDNNLATLEARAELALQGTLESPVVLGRAEIARGRVYFQGNTYVIRHGSIDFADPRATNPLFDIEAETRVRSYRITLKMNGTLDRVYPTLSSDPGGLSQVQILNLLAGGDETAVAGLGASSRSGEARTAASQYLGAAGAATLVTGRLSEQVGLGRGAERLLGLNRFSIDPSVIRGEVGNPTARLTAGKRITPDLNVVYSIDLRGTEERIVSVEYNLSDRLSLLLTRSEPGGTGFDLRVRRSHP